MFQTLVLSGGSILGFAELGAIQFLCDERQLENIEKYVGTSIGSVISYLLILGYSSEEIMMSMMSSQTVFDRLSQLEILTMIRGDGATSFAPFHELLENMTLRKYDRLFTLRELYDKTQKDFILTTFNASAKRSEYLSHKTHPDLPVLTAVKMSCALPFVFAPCVYRNVEYLDGFFAENLALSQIDPEKEKAIAIHVVCESKGEDLADDNTKSDSCFFTDKSSSFFLQYLFRILNILLDRVRETTLEQHKHRCSKLIEIDVRNVSILSLNLSRSQKFDLFSTGYHRAREAFQ